MKTPRAICVAAGLMLASVAGCPARRVPRGFTSAPGGGSPTGRRGQPWSFAGRGQETVRRAVFPLSWRTGREILVDRTSAQPAEAHARTASAERQRPPARLYGRAAPGGAALHREFPQPGVAGTNIQLKDSFAPRCAESCHPWTRRSDHPQSLSLRSGSAETGTEPPSQEVLLFKRQFRIALNRRRGEPLAIWAPRLMRHEFCFDVRRARS